MLKFIPYEVKTGKYNMDFDAGLLDDAIESGSKAPVLRLYGWSPACVSLGRNQSEAGINHEFCSRNGIDIVRRLTGGRALLHDREITYSFVCPIDFLSDGQSVALSYKQISNALIEGFKLLDIELDYPENRKKNTNFDYCMAISTGADLSYQGRKLIGSAQFRKQGYLLQHGSILIDLDEKKIENIFGVPPDKSSLCTLNEIKKIDENELIDAIYLGFKAEFILKTP